jgi:catechol 2,3-dioxygenase-like lactoylglutathione lyase family enzyme
VIQGIEHTAIAAADAGKLAEWYSSVLGFAIAYRSANAIFVSAPDGTMIEIVNAEGERGANSLKSPGLRHLALTVTDFDAVYDELKRKGVSFSSEPEEKKGNKVVFFTDSKGNHLHLLQRSAPLVRG